MTTKLELENAHALKRIAAALERIADNQTVRNALEFERKNPGFLGSTYESCLLRIVENQVYALITKSRKGGE